MTTVYLAGPINGCADGEAIEWRQFVQHAAPNCNYLDPMRRDYRGVEDQCVNEIVKLDLADIDNSDIFLAYCWQCSWGTAMELFYAHSIGKRVVTIVPEGNRISPWLRFHSDAIMPSLGDAVHLLRALPRDA